MLYSTGEEDGWVNEKKKGKTAKTFAVMTMHYDNAWGWSQTSDYSQSIQPGTVLATATEAKAKEGQADHPADHAADGSDVSDEASDHAAHGSSKTSSEAPEDVIGWWEMEADSEAEDARLEKWTKEEKAQEAEDIRKRVAEFEAGTHAWQQQRVDIRMRVAATHAWQQKKVAEFWKLEVERLRRRRDMLNQQIEKEEVKEFDKRYAEQQIEEEEVKQQIEFEKKQEELQEIEEQEADLG